MRIIRAADYDDMCCKAARMLSAKVLLKPNCVLGLATGSTPVSVYKYLAEWYRRGEADFSGVSSVNLDEYVGLAPDNPQSYRYYMEDNFFKHVNIKPENTNLPNGLAPDKAQECARYDAVIRGMGGVDIQLLGMGQNGHIGFNEPGECFENGTHCVALAESTIRANSRFFSSEAEVPRFAYTMGIGAIMRARRVLVVVSGAEKAQAVKDACTGPVTPEVPASILQMHADAVLIGDKEALSLLP